MPQAARNASRDTPELRRARIVDEAVRVIGQKGGYGFRIQELHGMGSRPGDPSAGVPFGRRRTGAKDVTAVP